MSLKNYINDEKLTKEGVKLTPDAKFAEELGNAILLFLETYASNIKREKRSDGLLRITKIDLGDIKKIIDNLKDNIFFNSNTGELKFLKEEGYQKLKGLEDSDIEKAIVDQKQKLLEKRVKTEIFDHLFPKFSEWMKKHTPAPKQSTALISELSQRLNKSGDSSSVANKQSDPLISTSGGVRVDAEGNHAALMSELSQRLEKHYDSSPVTGGGGSADSEYASAVVNKGSGHEELKDTETTPELDSAKKNISQWKSGIQVPTIKQDLAILFNEGSPAEIIDALKIDAQHATKKGGMLHGLIGNKNYNEIRKDPNLTHFGSAKFLTNLSDDFIKDLNQDEKNKVKELAESCKTTAKSGYTRGFFGGKKSSDEIEKLNSLIEKLNNGPGVAPRK